MAYADLDLTALASLLGDYYQQRKDEVLTKVYGKEVLRKICTVISGVQDEFVITEMIIGELLQAYQEDFTPKGSMEFTAEVLKNYPLKVDYTFSPKRLEGTWLGYLKTNGSSAEEYPFVEFIYDKLLGKLAEDLGNAEINGVYSAPVAGTAGSASASMNGVLKQLATAITATKITVYATGVISASTVIADVEGLYQHVPEKYRDLNMTAYLPAAIAMMYFKARREAYGDHIDYKPGETKIPFTNWNIEAVPNMGASQRMWVTMKDNFIMLEDGVYEEENLEIEKEKRKLNCMMDFKRGVGFGIIGQVGGTTSDQYVWCNDQT